MPFFFLSPLFSPFFRVTPPCDADDATRLHAATPPLIFASTPRHLRHKDDFNAAALIRFRYAADAMSVRVTPAADAYVYVACRALSPCYAAYGARWLIYFSLPCRDTAAFMLMLRHAYIRHALFAPLRYIRHRCVCSRGVCSCAGFAAVPTHPPWQLKAGRRITCCIAPRYGKTHIYAAALMRDIVITELSPRNSVHAYASESSCRGRIQH